VIVHERIERALDLRDIPFIRDRFNSGEVRWQVDATPSHEEQAVRAMASLEPTELNEHVLPHAGDVSAFPHFRANVIRRQ
jgi:hypothetical protein